MMKRLTKILALGIGIASLLSQSVLAQTKSTYQLQKEFIDMRFGMFIHFNLGTFTNEEWAEPNQDPMKFAPTNVDAAQWAATAKAAGMKFGILTTKHHDGFSLWPTKYGKKNSFGTYQNVMYSGWKKDIVRTFVDEFRKAGLTPCIYYSIWDRTQGIQGGALSAANKEVIKGQLTELLGGNYGQFPLIIFDGWSWMMGHRDASYQFIRETVKSLQPNCMIADHNGLIQPFEEDIINFEWFTAPTGNTFASTRGVSITPSGWFWHPNTPTRDPMTLANIVNGPGLATTEPRYCNLLLNCPPNKAGRIDDNVVTRLKEVGAAWKPNMNRAPLPTQPEQCERPITPVSATATSNGNTAGNVFDGVMNYENKRNVRQSLWQTSGNFPQSVTIDLGKSIAGLDMITYMPRQDHATDNTGGNPNNLVTDGNVLGYNIYVSTNNSTFTKVASGTWNGDWYVKRVKFTPTTSRYVRLEILSAKNSTFAIVGEFGAGISTPAGTVTALEDELSPENEAEVRAFPNPFSGDIQLRAKGDFTYSIYDMTGGLVEKGKGCDVIFAASSLPIGMYLIKIEVGAKSNYVKVVKN